MAGHSADQRWCHSGRNYPQPDHQRPTGAFVMRWLLVGIIAICNTLGDVLNTAGMKRQGEVEDLRPRSLFWMVRRAVVNPCVIAGIAAMADRKSTRLNSSHPSISYAVFCLKKKNIQMQR